MIVVYPRGQLSAKDKQRMTKHGILCIEADDPKSVVCILPAAPFVSPDDLLLAAIRAADTEPGHSSRGTFTTELRKLIDARRAKSE